MARIKDPVMTEQRVVVVGSSTYTRRVWADGWVQHYRHNKRQACLIKLDVLTHAKLSARIEAALAE
jgi:hypothetical protein